MEIIKYMVLIILFIFNLPIGLNNNGNFEKKHTDQIETKKADSIYSRYLKWVAVITISVCSFSFATAQTYEDLDKEYRLYQVRNEFRYSPPNETNVKKVIELLDIQFPDIVLRQAICESGGFKSKLTKRGNNIFGMRLARKRKTTAIGKCGGYAQYAHWVESVIDYKLWQGDKPITENYVTYLKRKNYCMALTNGKKYP